LTYGFTVGVHNVSLTVSDGIASPVVVNTSVTIVDTTAPLLAITLPASPPSPRYVRALSTISGTSSDDVGVTHVDIFIQRNSDGLFWDGSEWGTPEPLSTTYNASAGTWTRTSGLPGFADLDNGDSYSIYASSYDAADNRSDVQQDVIADKIKPVVLMTTPAYGAFINALPSIAGSVTDDVSSSLANGGVSNIGLKIQRVLPPPAPSQFWNFSTQKWDATATGTTTPVSGTTWNLSSGLPSGALLPEGEYRLFATGIDAAGNSQTINTRVQVDKTTPLVAITAPVNGSYQTSFPALTGTASDPASSPATATSGLKRVAVVIYNVTADTYWDGSAFVSVANPLNAPVLSTTLAGGNWSRSSVPTFADGLTDGVYRVIAGSEDNAGNLSTQAGNPNAVVTFTIDHTVPTVAITAPSDGFVNALSAVTGTASDATSGVQSVVLSLLDDDSDLYWNPGTGAFDSAAPVAISTTLTGGTWTANAAQLPGTNLTDGHHLVLIATATDAGGLTGVSSGSLFTVDTVKPAIAITSPVAGPVANLDTISGTSSDSAGAANSGVASIALSIVRQSDGFYWNGTWQAAPASLSVTPGATWSQTAGLPTAADLDEEGSYTLSAVATDIAGNVQSSSAVQVVIDKTAPLVTITAPVSETGFARSLGSAITGTASDTRLARVEVRIKKASNNTYWDGTAFVPVSGSPAIFQTLGNTSPWSTSATMPTAGSGLTDGLYCITATAVDSAGRSSTATRTITIDNTAPTTTVLEPVSDGAYLRNLLRVKGNASDNGGSGIDHISIQLSRRSDGQFWTGSEWGGLTVLRTQGTDVWKITPETSPALPPDSKMLDGKYDISISTYDLLGNSRVTQSFGFIIAHSAPPISVTTPTAGSNVSSLPVIDVTPTDPNNYLTSVRVYLCDTIRQVWWNGTGWQATTAFVPAVRIGSGNSSVWRGTQLPAGNDLREARYKVNAVGYDAANNTSSSTVNFTALLQAPGVAISQPLSSATSLQTLSGTAVDAGDAAIASGIRQVDVQVYSRAQAKWWNGATWSSTATWLPTMLADAAQGVTWSRSEPGLSGAASGAYTISARVYDRCNLQGAASKAVTLNNTASVTSVATVAASPAASSVQLSTISASTLGTVTLTFTGALGTSSTDAARYAVQLADSAANAELESVRLLNPSTVVLTLASGSLSTGAHLSVRYNLLDGSGKALTGQAAATAK
jgi:hypothetical protein